MTPQNFAVLGPFVRTGPRGVRTRCRNDQPRASVASQGTLTRRADYLPPTFGGLPDKRHPTDSATSYAYRGTRFVPLRSPLAEV